MPVATAAFQMRAPSRCSASPRARARRGDRDDRGARPDAAAAPVVRVLDRDQARARQVAIGGQRSRLELGGGERAVGRRRSRRTARPAHAAAGARFVQARVRASPTITSSPGRQCSSSAIWLAIVPLGTNSAASLPRSSAARSSSARAVGSSPHTSSPTSAAAIASRIAGVGRVTVSDRRSTIRHAAETTANAPTCATSCASTLVSGSLR